MNLFQRADIGLDLGTSKFSICVRGEGLVATQPACLAYRGSHLTSSSVVSIGADAKEMQGRVSDKDLHLLYPMKDGVIVHRLAATLILKKMAKSAGLSFGLGHRSTLVTSLLGSSLLERRAFLDVGASLGRSRVVSLDEPLAAAHALPVDLSEPFAQMVIDVGEGATELIVVAFGKKILGRSLRVGGDALDRAIVDTMRMRHSLLISLENARVLKEALSDSFLRDEESSEVRVCGRDLQTNIPGFRSFSARDLKAVIDRVHDPILHMIREVLAQIPPEVSVDLIENGIYLCGGGARVMGLRERIARETDLEVRLMESPENAVIRGTERLLDYVRYY